MREIKFCQFVSVILLLTVGTSVGYAKGGGWGFWAEGTVTAVSHVDDAVEFSLEGDFWIKQYRDNNSRHVVKLSPAKGISIAGSQNKPFFAMSHPDWFGGAIQKPGGLLRILEKAKASGNRIKVEFVDPTIIYSYRLISLKDTKIIRITDHDLK